jgi:hypothetical protein
MATTTNYSWSTPDDTALVKDGAAAIRSLGTAIDSTVFTNAGAAINKTIIDAKGDLIVGTAADTAARLAVGVTNGHVLQVDSSTASGLKWDAVAAGGMTLINTGGTTLSGASVTISSIPAIYQHLQIVVRNFKPASDQALMLRFNGDSALRYDYVDVNGTGNFSAAQIVISYSNDNGTADGLSVINVPDYANTTTWKIVDANSWENDPTTPANYRFTNRFGAYNQTGAISSLTLLPSGGVNFTSGTAFVYGVK